MKLFQSFFDDRRIDKTLGQEFPRDDYAVFVAKKLRKCSRSTHLTNGARRLRLQMRIGKQVKP